MFYGPSSYISTSMILGDGGQMLMVTEEQDHEYLENGKRYQKMSTNRPSKTRPFYVYIGCVSCLIFIIWCFGRGFNIQKSVKWSICEQKSKIMNISKTVRDIKKCQKTDPLKHAHFTSV